MLARMLVRLAELAGASGDDAADVGREQGQHRRPAYTRGGRRASRPSSHQLDTLGFDPAVDGSDDGETAVIGFAHCPFRELAEAHPGARLLAAPRHRRGFRRGHGRRRRSTTSTRSCTVSLVK